MVRAMGPSMAVCRDPTHGITRTIVNAMAPVMVQSMGRPIEYCVMDHTMRFSTV